MHTYYTAIAAAAVYLALEIQWHTLNKFDIMQLPNIPLYLKCMIHFELQNWIQQWRFW